MAEVTINFTLQSDGVGSATADKTQPKTKQSKETEKAVFSTAMALQVAKRLSTQVVDGYINSIGERTGNYVQQQQINTAKMLTGKAIGVGAAFVANPILGGVALVSEGIGTAFDLASKNREIAWQNREAEQLCRRAGYTAGYNR